MSSVGVTTRVAFNDDDAKYRGEFKIMKSRSCHQLIKAVNFISENTKRELR